MADAARIAALRAELAALEAEDDDAEEVAEVVAEAVADTAEAVADSVAEAVADEAPEPVVVVEQPPPDPVDEAVAVAIATEAITAHDVAVIEAQAAGEVQIIEAQAAVLEDDEPEPVVPDKAPEPEHWFYRPLFGGKRG